MNKTSSKWKDLKIHTCVHAKLLQLCPTLCDSMDSSPPGSSVHGILQARILEWVAMRSSRGIFPTQGSNPHLLRLLHWQAGSLPTWRPIWSGEQSFGTEPLTCGVCHCSRELVSELNGRMPCWHPEGWLVSGKNSTPLVLVKKHFRIVSICLAFWAMSFLGSG